MDDTAPLVSGVHVGDVLGGRYRVEKILGWGGMGIVVAATHVQLDHRVAIKFLLPQALANADAVSRFAREGRAAVKIQSDHVARVSDVGTLDNGAPYIVMEYLEGKDLAAWVSEQGALPTEQAVDFVLQACEAIAEAHTLGIVHRDLKPANLFVVRRPDGAYCVKVLDFGISKMGLLAGSEDRTQTSAVMGSPMYMSPEQMQSSKDVDARSDIWAVGVILFELLTGVTPFMADSMPALVLRVVSGEPERLLARRPDLPVPLQEVISACLARDRERRFQTVADVAVALLPFGSKQARVSVQRITGIMHEARMGSGTTMPASSSHQPGAQPAAVPSTSWGRTTFGRGRGPWFVGTLAALLLLATAGATIHRYSGASPTPSTPASNLATRSSVEALGARAPAAPVAPEPPVTAEPRIEPIPQAATTAHALGPAPAGDALAQVSSKKPAEVPHKKPDPAPRSASGIVPTATVVPTATALTTAAAPLEQAPRNDAQHSSGGTSPSAPGADCAQKFYFDSQGNKHFKAKCFH